MNLDGSTPWYRRKIYIFNLFKVRQTILFQMSLPKLYWSETLLIYVYQLNCVLSCVIGSVSCVRYMILWYLCTKRFQHLSTRKTFVVAKKQGQLYYLYDAHNVLDSVFFTLVSIKVWFFCLTNMSSTQVSQWSCFLLMKCMFSSLFLALSIKITSILLFSFRVWYKYSLKKVLREKVLTKLKNISIIRFRTSQVKRIPFIN